MWAATGTEFMHIFDLPVNKDINKQIITVNILYANVNFILGKVGRCIVN